MTLKMDYQTGTPLPLSRNVKGEADSRLSIALVVHDLHERGGQSLYTKILADELSRRHRVEVFANVCERSMDTRWQTHHVRAWRVGAQATVQTFPIGLRAHEAGLSEFQIQHAQGYCGGQPNIVTAHICVAAYLDSLRAVALRHRLSLQLMAAAESRFYRNYDGPIIAVSRKVAGELREFYKARGPISVIPHGVDGTRFESLDRDEQRARMREKLSLGEDELMVLYAGDLTKSHAYLKELAEAAPSVRFVIVTSSRGYHWKARNVRILPPTSHLERYYVAADAFVFPTTYDAFGMVLLEAMASGLAVFSSDRAGAAELVNDGVDGFITPLDQWVEATSVRLKDRARLLEIGSAAQRTARQHDWSTVVKAVERLYFQIASLR
jgi:UDP-glucose:(heptosyl)LPS alpha-1,3-glucosyltransferase